MLLRFCVLSDQREVIDAVLPQMLTSLRESCSQEGRGGLSVHQPGPERRELLVLELKHCGQGFKRTGGRHA